MCYCSTLKQGCEAGIKLKLSADGQSIVVTDISEDHNHDVKKVGFQIKFIVTSSHGADIWGGNGVWVCK